MDKRRKKDEMYVFWGSGVLVLALLSVAGFLYFYFGKTSLSVAPAIIDNTIVVLEPLSFVNQVDEFCELDLFAIYEKTKEYPSMFYTLDREYSNKVGIVIAYCQGNGMMSAHLEGFQAYLGSEDSSQINVVTDGQFDIESGEITLIIDGLDGSYTLRIPISNAEKGDYIELSFVNGEIIGVPHAFDREFAESLLAMK